MSNQIHSVEIVFNGTDVRVAASIIVKNVDGTARKVRVSLQGVDPVALTTLQAAVQAAADKLAVDASNVSNQAAALKQLADTRAALHVEAERLKALQATPTPPVAPKSAAKSPSAPSKS